MFIGVPRKEHLPGGTLLTAGAKTTVEEAFLGFDNFDGDRQANLRHHGGRDRTACVYIASHYEWWRSAHGMELRPGSFCENLTIAGIAEDTVCIGDVFRAGEALVQVSLPRDPCRTLDRLTGIPGLWKLARDSGRCGFHMRTLEEGLVRKGDQFVLVRRHPAGITVAAALDLSHGRSRDRDLARRLDEMPEFAKQGKGLIAEMLAARPD
jgi:MOSC domain-containing protein YiiM